MMATAFIHCFQVNHWRETLIELLALMKPVAFNEIRITAVGDQILPVNVDEQTKHVSQFASGHEALTLRDVWRYARATSEDPWLFYCHCKGVTHPEIRDLEDDWWRMMAHFLLEKHQEATEWLKKGASCVGVNYRDHPGKHFSGNFWWTRAAYVRTLAEPVEAPEFWVCSGKFSSLRSLHESGLNHFFHRYQRERYVSVEQRV